VVAVTESILTGELGANVNELFVAVVELDDAVIVVVLLELVDDATELDEPEEVELLEVAVSQLVLVAVVLELVTVPGDDVE
jgi:hypothetical protein